MKVICGEVGRGAGAGAGRGHRSGISGRDGAAGNHLYATRSSGGTRSSPTSWTGKGISTRNGTPIAHEVVGDNYFDMKRECACSAESLVLYGDGDAVVITTQERPVRFLLVSGKPIGEPVAWYGPIVMNTQEELRIAFEEYEKGTFIKHQ